ncbi:MAG: hypothetical protein KC589_00095 [Nanoarchaeota archaeon]|nr:hypothetical protein [Nanoarchaeota archaeon]
MDKLYSIKIFFYGEKEGVIEFFLALDNLESFKEFIFEIINIYCSGMYAVNSENNYNYFQRYEIPNLVKKYFPQNHGINCTNATFEMNEEYIRDFDVKVSSYSFKTKESRDLNVKELLK